jgi:hypothetical protein
LLHLPWLAQKFLEKDLTALRFIAPKGEIPVMVAKPTKVDRVVLCSHGTNSHKEVFFFPARVLSWFGSLVLSNDATSLSTEEGLIDRVTDLRVGAFWAQGTLGKPTVPVHLIGHSDGCPPSVRARNQHPDIFSGNLVVLGSFLDEAPAPMTPTLGLSGAFDQIFPTAEMREDVLRPDAKRAEWQVSWLSDHFTEQYDPLLLTRLVTYLTGEPAPELPWVFAGFIALVAVCGAACFLTGMIGIRIRSWVFFWCLFGGSMVAFALDFSGILLRGWVVCLWLGLAVPRRLVTVAKSYVPGFFLAMEANIVLSSGYFWRHVAEGLPWLPVFLLWYPVAWGAKVTLYMSWLSGKVAIGGFPLVPVLLCLAVVVNRSGFWGGVQHPTEPRVSHALSSRKIQRIDALPDPNEDVRVLHTLSSLPAPLPLTGTAAPDAAPAADAGWHSQQRTAAILLGVAALLWGIRFFQGMVQPEILQAVLGNYCRTLLVPTFYLVGRLFVFRAPAHRPESK